MQLERPPNELRANRALRSPCVRGARLNDALSLPDRPQAMELSLSLEKMNFTKLMKLRQARLAVALRLALVQRRCLLICCGNAALRQRWRDKEQPRTALLACQL